MESGEKSVSAKSVFGGLSRCHRHYCHSAKCPLICDRGIGSGKLAFLGMLRWLLMKKDFWKWHERGCLAREILIGYPIWHKLPVSSRTGTAARVSHGVWCLTRETDAEPGAFRNGINSTHAPSPLTRFGHNEMGGNKFRTKPRHILSAVLAFGGI